MKCAKCERQGKALALHCAICSDVLRVVFIKLSLKGVVLHTRTHAVLREVMTHLLKSVNIVPCCCEGALNKLITINLLCGYLFVYIFSFIIKVFEIFPIKYN